MEVWKNIPNFQGYQVSNLGQVRTHNKISYTERHGIRHWKDRILKQRSMLRSNGYKDYKVALWKDGKEYEFLVARLVSFTFYNKDINDRKLTCNHIDGNCENNSIDNLEIISLKDNIRHAFRTGLCKTQIKIKIVDKITGTIIYPSSLNEGNKIINKGHSYLHDKIKRNIFENDKYMWEVL